MLTELSASAKVVGAKQVRRALDAGRARRVFLARDADARITGDIADVCRDKGVAVEWTGSMGELGRSCGIRVGAAVAAIVAQ